MHSTDPFARNLEDLRVLVQGLFMSECLGEESVGEGYCHCSFSNR